MILQNLSKTMNSYSIFTGRRSLSGVICAAAIIAAAFSPAALFAQETVSIEIGKKGESIKQGVETPNLPCEGEKNSVFNESDEKIVLEERNINASPAGEDYIFTGNGPYIFTAAGSVSTAEISVPPATIDSVIGGTSGESDEALVVNGGQLRFSAGNESTNIPSGSFTFMPRVWSSKIEMIWMCVYEAAGKTNGRQVLYNNKTMFIWKRTNDSLTAPPPAFFKGKPDNDFISKNVTATKYFSAGKKYNYTVPDKNKLYYFQTGYRWKKGFDAKDMSAEEKEMSGGGFMIINPDK